MKGLGIFITVLLFTFSNVEGAGLVHLTDAQFDQTVSEGLVVVDFHAKWCPPCRKFGPVFSAVAEESEGILFAKVDVDQARKVSRRLKIQSIPAIVILRDGKEVKRHVGSLSASQLKDFIAPYLR